MLSQTANSRRDYRERGLANEGEFYLLQMDFINRLTKKENFTKISLIMK